MLKAKLSKGVTYPKFSDVIGVVASFGFHNHTSYKVKRRNKVHLELRCPKVDCSFVIRAHVRKITRDIHITKSDLNHTCDGKTTRSRQIKTSVVTRVTTAVHNFVPVMVVLILHYNLRCIVTTMCTYFLF